MDVDFFNELAAHGLLGRMLLHLDFKDDPKLLAIGHPALDHAVKHDTHIILQRFRATRANVVVLSGTFEERSAFQGKYFNMPTVWDRVMPSFPITRTVWEASERTAFIGSGFKWFLQYDALVAILLPADMIVLSKYYFDYASHLYSTFEQFVEENKGKKFVLLSSKREKWMRLPAQTFAMNYNILRIMSGMGGLAYSN